MDTGSTGKHPEAAIILLDWVTSMEACLKVTEAWINAGAVGLTTFFVILRVGFTPGDGAVVTLPVTLGRGSAPVMVITVRITARAGTVVFTPSAGAIRSRLIPSAGMFMFRVRARAI